MTRCDAKIWPSWASKWLPCGSLVVSGQCVEYGHETDQRRGELAAAISQRADTSGLVWISHGSLSAHLYASDHYSAVVTAFGTHSWHWILYRGVEQIAVYPPAQLRTDAVEAMAAAERAVTALAATTKGAGNAH